MMKAVEEVSTVTKNKLKMDRLCEQLVERFVTWAEACSDIRAAVIIGSRARVDHSADEWADLDIVVITTYPERYISTSDWIKNIGDPLLTFVERTSGGDIERRVLFERMLDVDFAIVSKSRALQLLQGEIPREIAAQISNTFRRGMRVILDKDGMAAQLRRVISSIDSSIPRPPTQHEFLEVVNDFLYHAVFTAKHLRRGELWWTVTCLDCYMQLLLLRMMEWHARAIHGWNYDTWFRGRFLEEWAHPQALKELRGAFAHNDGDDVKHALLVTVNLFRWIAVETADKLDYSYPTKVDERVTKWVRTCLPQNTGERI
jgi:aminoglycoside 6-adenylyltransferase